MTSGTVLSMFAVAVALSSLGATRAAPTRQEVVITMKIFPESAFVLTPGQPGILTADSGNVTGDWSAVSGREVVRGGQTIGIYVSTWMLAGRHGTLTIRERRERTRRVGDVDDAAVAVGTWKVVRGTGVYAALAGGGGSGHVGRGNSWHARLDGFLAAR
jgi:hypothetical protein